MERIKLNNVSKKFNLEYRKPKSTLAGFISFILRKKEKKEIQVLNDISFSVKRGEVVGIIGRNGSGKSTLLRIIARIYEKDSGTLETNGSAVYISGFNSGLNEKLTMRENIFLVGSLLDLSQRDIKRKFNEIIEFSGLKDFVDVEVSKFSSGMIARLAFSIIIFCISHKNPDILLLDEVFNSGGDEEFGRKSLIKIEEIIKKGTSVIMVSHDLGLIKKYCSKCILLDKGRIIKEGKSDEVVEEYLKSINQYKNK